MAFFKKYLKEYKDKVLSFTWAFIGGFISFIVTVKIIPTNQDSPWLKIGIASGIIGFGAGFPTLYSIYQQYSLRKNLKILIYEDEDQREDLVKNLKNAGYDVIAFGSGGFQNAIEAVKQDKKIKVAIVDQIIKDEKRRIINQEQGFELVQKFPHCDRADIRCIILTGDLLDKASWIGGNRDLAIKIDNYLKEENVVDVIHKQLYKLDKQTFTQALYTRIIRQIDAAIKAGDIK